MRGTWRWVSRNSQEVRIAMKRIVCSLVCLAFLGIASLTLSSGSANAAPPMTVFPESDFRPPAPTIPRTLFGLDMNYFVTTKQPWPSIPFGSLRLWDSATGWAQLNPRKGEYDWSQLDK